MAYSMAAEIERDLISQRTVGALRVQQGTAHESARTTELYDRSDDDMSLDEVEQIVI